MSAFHNSATAYLQQAFAQMQKQEWTLATQLFQQALLQDPRLIEAHVNLGILFLNQGLFSSAIDHLQQAINLRPDIAELHSKLGTALLWSGHGLEAIQAYDNATNLKYGSNRPTTDKQFLQTTLVKLHHDSEQLKYLLERSLLSAEYERIRANYQLALQDLADQPAGAILPLPTRLKEQQPGYNRLWYRHSANQVTSGSILNPALDPVTIEADYQNHAPGLTIVDQFLQPEVLDQLYTSCLASTLWFHYEHEYYLGSYMQSGFLSPLLWQIAEALRTTLPGIFQEHLLTQAWAYKYDSRLPGIQTHADFAAINVNFWITPDEANLDLESGGMVIWDREAPYDWDFDAYNRDQGLIHRYLDSQQAKETRIPHRQNRCVIFNSNLFHRTDTFHFRPGYENRRINITLLYGFRGGSIQSASH